MFDGRDVWSFGNGFARNVIIFCVYNSSLPHSSSGKKFLQCLVKDQLKILIPISSLLKKFSITFSKYKILLKFAL